MVFLRIQRKYLKRGCAAALALSFCLLYSKSPGFRKGAQSAVSCASSFGAALIIPEGIGEQDKHKAEASSAQPRKTAAEPTSTAAEPAAATTAATTAASTAASAKPANAGAYDGRVITQKIGNSGKNYGKVYLSNKTPLTIDLKRELSISPDVAIYKNSSPQVLIIHTHATECYLPEDSGYYKKSWPSRTSDNTKNMIAVGDVVSRKLNEAGIVTLHDTTKHDEYSYNGSYERSTKTVEKYLKEYPSIDVVLDLHRDALTTDNGTKIKPTVKINGKPAAQMMICTGSQTGDVTGYPDWRQNLRFALRVQQAVAEKYEGLMRPVYFVSKKYNHQLSHGSILIEMGSEANTLAEAQYSAELLSNALIDLLGTSLCKN
jgi:stage II sporulation protein P